MEFVSTDMQTALPEIMLAVAAMGLLMLGAFSGDGVARMIGWICVATLAFAAAISYASAPSLAFDGTFVVDGMTVYSKVLIFIAAAVTTIMCIGAMRTDRGLDRFEFPILLLLATLGMGMMVSANDLISLYVGLELQSLSLYVVTAFKRESTRASEAGLKYFVLGALASGLLLYGASLVYGFTGSTQFNAIANSIEVEGVDIGLVFGLVFLAAGLAFKISAVPFHMWTPDVYEGAPTAVTAFLAAAPKLAAMVLFARVVVIPFEGAIDSFQQILTFVAVASMFLGAFAAIGQRNIKRLMAYSSIGHMGYALVGLAAGTEDGIKGVLIYMTIYVVMTIGTFAFILAMRRAEGMVESIDELSGLSRTHPGMALGLGVLIFSLAGIPPLAGFWGKFYVFSAAVEAGLYPLAVLGVIASVIGAYYYLRIVKIMYMDAPRGSFEPMRRDLGTIAAVSAAFVVLFILSPITLVDAAQTAASALFPVAG